MTQVNYHRSLKYNEAAGLLRLEFPNSWDAENLTGVDLRIVDKAGGTLLADDAATIYTATSLAADAAAGARTITLDSAATNLSRGDRIRLVLPDEDVVVESYNSTSKVATLRDSLLSAHLDDSAVYGLFATYELDTSDTTTFTAGLECVLVWTPDSGDSAITEAAEVEGHRTEIMQYRERFAALYPVEYELAQMRLDSIYAEAHSRLKYRLQGKNLNLNRIVDQEILTPALLDLMRWLIVLGGGDSFAGERESAWAAFLLSEDSLCSQPVWVDADADLIETEDEVEVHEPQRRARGL